MRAAIYTRRSIEVDETNTSNSLEVQRSACENYCRSKGWEIVPERYDDAGISGKTMDRPGFKRLLRDLKARKFDTIVAFRYDRLSRSMLNFQQLLLFIEELKRKQNRNLVIACASQDFDTSTSTGRLMVNMIISFAEFEREGISDRMKSTYAHKKKLGKVDRVPYGFARETETRLCVHPEEMLVLQRIFNEKNQGMKYVDIAFGLNDDGILYRNNKLWTFSMCQRRLMRALELSRTRPELAHVERAYFPDRAFEIRSRVREAKLVSLDFADLGS